MRVPGYSCTLFLLSLAISAVVGQDASFDTLVDHYESIQVLNDTSNGFVVEYHNWYKVVRNLVTNENYAVVCCNQKATTLKGFTAILNEPLQTVGVSDAQSVLSFIELLGLSDVVRSANSYKAITSPCYTNLTATPNTATGTVDAIFATRPTSNQLTNTPYISFSADTNTLTPLQKASWLVYVGFFFGKESEATTAYHTIQNSYNCHKSNLQSTGNVSIVWAHYDTVTSRWNTPQDAYHTQLIQDAGMKFLNPSSTSEYSSVSAFQNAIKKVDYVIDDTDLGGFKDPSYTAWLNLTGFSLAKDSNKTFIAGKHTFRHDRLLTKDGYSDWTERSPARPDLVLTDIIHMVYPTYQTAYSFVWFHNFAKGDPSYIVSADTYGSCTNTGAMLNQLACISGKFTAPSSGATSSSSDTNLTKSSGLSTGGKVGVAIGVLAGVAAVVTAGYVTHKRKSNTPGRTFYKMNDV